MEMLEKINLSKTIVSECISKNDENYGLYFLTCYGLLSKFGDEYLPLIEEFFRNTDFFIEDEPLEYLVYTSGEKDYNYIGEDAIGFGKYNVTLNDNFQYVVVERKPKICMTTTNKKSNEKLTIFTHESAHIIKSLINGIFRDSNSVTLRGGLRIWSLDTNDLDADWIHYNDIFDEVLNVFQTADMMEYICQLDPNLLDDETRRFYDGLDLDTLSEPSGYVRCTPLLKTLWENTSFKSSIETNIVTGQINNIISDFDTITGDGSFSLLSRSIDEVAKGKNKLIKLKSKRIVKSIVSKYNNNSFLDTVQKVKC